MNYIKQLIYIDIDTRERVLRELNQSDFQRKLSYEVRYTIYKLYDYCQDVSYRMLDNLDDKTLGDIEEYISFYSTKFQEFIFDVLELYELDTDKIFL